MKTEPGYGVSCQTGKGCKDLDSELCIDDNLYAGEDREEYQGPCLCYCHSEEVENGV